MATETQRGGAATKSPPRAVSGQHSAVSFGFEPPDERGEHTLDLGGSLGKLLKTLAIEQPELVGKEQFVFELAHPRVAEPILI